MASGRVGREGLQRTKALWHRGLLAGLLLSLTALSSGCFFLDFSVSFLNNIVSISIAETQVGACQQLLNTLDFSCDYEHGPETTNSAFSVSGPGLNFRLLILDPLVVQLPSAASNFAGSFLHADSGLNGALAINAGLPSVAADASQTLTAEPGTQLVTIALPAGAPTTGTFNFNFNFQVPPGTTSLTMKPLLTGLVEVNGQTFYSPLLPCVTAMPAVPAITTPLPVPGNTLSLPSITGLGCQNTIYTFGQAMPIPTVPQWGLILLTLSLLTTATWQLAGRPVMLGAGASGAVTIQSIRHDWLTSLLLGQSLAALGLGLYALLLGPLVPHDGVGAFLSGLLIGVMVECYRRSR